ncbi:MAG: hypothetical protein MI743_16735, partial [Sneathiellales bacterium]|nr:hypothetical protein [Sneathiellales bacterium]
MPEGMGAAKKLRYRLEWLIVRFAFWLFHLIGRKRASDFGSWLARKVGPRMKVHELARRNMKRALPELSDQQIDRHLVEMWDNLGRNAAEFPFMGQVDVNSTDVELVGNEIVDKVYEEGKPAFFVTAHYGPWELTIVVAKYFKGRANVVYRAANNPFVNDYFQATRFNEGYSFIPKGRKGARGILKALKNNEIVALLNDQKQNSGLPVPFFGRDAMTAQPLAELACKYDLPIYPMKPERLENGTMRVTIQEP